VDEYGRTPLHHAASTNAVMDVARLLAEGADVDAADGRGFTPLHLACQEWAIQAAMLLVDVGAAVDAVNLFANTPLHTAVFNSGGRGELIQILRRCGADPFRVNRFGQSPVGLARLIKNYDVARYFADLRE